MNLTQIFHRSALTAILPNRRHQFIVLYITIFSLPFYNVKPISQICPNGSFSFPILQSSSVAIGHISIAPNLIALSNNSTYGKPTRVFCYLSTCETGLVNEQRLHIQFSGLWLYRLVVKTSGISQSSTFTGRIKMSVGSFSSTNLSAVLSSF